MKEIVPQQVHSLNQDLPLVEGEEEQSHALALSHDWTNGGGQQQGRSSYLQEYWVQVMLHEKKQQQKQQEVMVGGKRRLAAAVVMVDGIVQVKVCKGRAFNSGFGAATCGGRGIVTYCCNEIAVRLGIPSTSYRG